MTFTALPGKVFAAKVVGTSDIMAQGQLLPDGKLVSLVDFAYPDHRLAIELDSEAYHMDRLSFRGDRRKQNRALVLGWTVLRYTWWDLHERAAQVETEIRAALEASSAEHA